MRPMSGSAGGGSVTAPNVPTLATAWDPATLVPYFGDDNGLVLRNTATTGAGKGCGQFAAVPGGTEIIAGIVCGVGQRNAYALGGIAVHDGSDVDLVGHAAPDNAAAIGRARFSHTTGARSSLVALSGAAQWLTLLGGTLHVGVVKSGGSWYGGWSLDGTDWMLDTVALVTPTHYGIAMNADGIDCYVRVGHLLATTSIAAYAAALPTMARL